MEEIGTKMFGNPELRIDTVILLGGKLERQFES